MSGCGIPLAFSTPRIKVIKFAISNPESKQRIAEDVVVKVEDIRKIAPDFNASMIVITTSNAANLDEDARTLETFEAPSQADDVDGDGKLDEVSFQIDLGPKQTRIVTIAYGDPSTVNRL